MLVTCIGDSYYRRARSRAERNLFSPLKTAIFCVTPQGHRPVPMHSCSPKMPASNLLRNYQAEWFSDARSTSFPARFWMHPLSKTITTSISLIGALKTSWQLDWHPVSTFGTLLTQKSPNSVISASQILQLPSHGPFVVPYLP